MMPAVQLPKPIVRLAGVVGNFTVTIRPLPDDEAPSLQQFDAYIAARTAARALRWRYGTDLVDEVDPCTRKAAEAAEAARLEAKRGG